MLVEGIREGGVVLLPLEGWVKAAVGGLVGSRLRVQPPPSFGFSF